MAGDVLCNLVHLIVAGEISCPWRLYNLAFICIITGLHCYLQLRSNCNKIEIWEQFTFSL